MSKKSRTFWRLLSLTLVLSMVFSPMLAMAKEQVGETSLTPAAQNPDATPPVKEAPDREEAQKIVSELPQDLLLQKIDPALQEAALAGGKEEVMLYVAVKGDANLEQYMRQRIERPEIFAGINHVYGMAYAGDLLDIARQENVLALVSYGMELRDKPYTPEEDVAPDLAAQQARIADLRASEVPFAEAESAAPDVSAQDWFDVRDGHKSIEAWRKGFTGEGVVVAAIDDGVDFGHPDLQGTYAWVTDEDSPYYGWPMAFSQVSAYYFALDVILGADLIASGGNGSRWVDTQETVEHSTSFEGEGEFTAMYQPLGSGVAYEYTLPEASQSGFYKFGSHPERNLENLYGHRVAMIVVDEHSDGVYDTVYVDLDNDKDFTDEKPVTQFSPEVYRDMDGDGYADISGGLLVWISDGDNPPPPTDWLWGITCADSSATMAGCPDPGELVLFTGPFDAGYSHGTQVASNIAGQGVVHGGLTDQPFRVGGMVRGAAPDVGVMDFSNHYYGGTDEDEYLVAALGYDGIPQSGDEVQITSNSYGAFGQMWGAFGYIGRLVTSLNMTVAPNTVWLFSAGNEGPGYGPQEGDSGPTTIQVGSSTQYGSTDWDSITSYDQVVYGDVTTFFSKGPAHDGSSGLDILANGGRGAGDEALNYFGYNGWTSWDTWGGTSRSAPVAAGNLALVYDAYYTRHGEWPTWEQAKALLKGGAEDPSGAPFYQGAGVINADASTDLAAGIYGVYATPTEWQVGDWMGTDYPAFPNLAEAGETYSRTYTLNNPSDQDIDVSIRDGVMVRIGEEELTFTTSDESEESAFNFHSPDYLLPLATSHGEHEGTVEIPDDAELMVVRYVHPYDTFDPDYSFSSPPNSSWRMIVYRWNDINGDGMLWEDVNSNGVVNHVGNGLIDNDGFERLDFGDPLTEIQEGEYIRTDYTFGGLAVPIYIRDPQQRMEDGYFFGFQHRYNDGSVPTTEFTIGVEFYRRVDWDWLSLSDENITVEAGAEATFDATVSIPADADIGAYEGMIFVDHEGDGYHEDHTVPLPVVINVMEALPDDGAITMGGGERSEHLYQNSYTYGYFNWYGGGWRGAGDWRHYFFTVDEADMENGNLLVHTSWEGGYPTDYNSFILGPTSDCASNGVPPCAWYAGDVGQPDPSIFGPYALWPIEQSEPMRSGAVYPFETSTGGPDDWLMTPIERTGLHEIALHQVLYAGEDLYSQFQVDVGTMDVEATMGDDGEVFMGEPVHAMAFTDTGTIEFQFTPTLDLPDLNGLLSGGLETDMYGPFTTNVPDTGQCYDPYCDANVYEEISVDRTDATELGVLVDVFDSQDLDLFLIYDSNDNGTPDPGIDALMGSSGNSAGTDESIVVADPPAGRYFVVFDGYDVDPDSGVDFDWEYWVTGPGDLPSEPIDVFSGTVTVNQDPEFEPTSASYTTTVTAGSRSAALHVTLDNIPAGNDVDVYITNAEGEIVAEGQEDGNAMEHLIVRPPEGQYRFEEDETFTIWVHGYDVPDAPITPTLHIWWDVLNVWLAEDSVAGPISAGETVTLTLHFQLEGWAPGDPDLSARLMAGPSGLPDAFDRLVVIERVDEAGLPTTETAFSKSIESERGPSSYLHNGYPTALANEGDTITFTLTIENVGDETATYVAQDWWLPAWEEFQGFVGSPPADYQVFTGVQGSFNVLVFTETVAPGGVVDITYTVTFHNAEGGTGWVIPNYFDVYDAANGYYYGGDINYAYIRDFRTTGSYKASDTEMVAPGETFNYTISLANPSAVDDEVLVVDYLDPNVSVVDPGPLTYDAAAHTLSWTGEMPGSSLASTDLVFTVQVAEDVPEGTTIWNEAVVYDKFYSDEITTLVDATIVDDQLDPELTIDKTVDRLLQLEGNDLEYTIVIENTGDELAENVEMQDPLPAGLEIDEESITGGAVYANNTVSWSGDLAAGDSHTITFRVTIGTEFEEGYVLINAATVRADNYPIEVYESALTEIRNLWSVLFPFISK